jgi:general secretion pathway protein K
MIARMSRGRRGFALLTALWLVVALSALAATGLLLVRDDLAASRNRIVLLRAGWAREACADILVARFRPDRPAASLDTVDLGRGVWCRAVVEDPSARLDVNAADSAALRTLLGDDSLVAALLDWRDTDAVAHPLGAEADWYRQHGRTLPRNGPLAAVAELGEIRGFDSATLARVTPLLTVRGTGRVDLNSAPLAVLATLPGFGPAELEAIAFRRRVGGRWSDLDGLIGALPPLEQNRLLARRQDLAARTATDPPMLVATVEGGVRGYPLRSLAVLTLVPTPTRLAVVRRESD